MTDIRNILKYLTQLTNVDFSEQKEKFSLLAQKYDKNNNSIFESDELEALKEDFLKFAEEDGNIEDLNEEEELKFTESLIQGNNSTKKQKNITKNKSHKNTISLINDMINLGKEKFIQTLSENTIFNGNLTQLQQLNLDELKRIETLLNINCRNTQFHLSEIVTLAKLSDEELERAKTLFYAEHRGKLFDGFEIAELAKLSDEEYKYVKDMQSDTYPNYDIYILVCLAKNYCPKIEQLLKNDCNIELLRDDENVSYHCKLFVSENKNEYYLCDNVGRFEHVTEQNKPERTKTVVNEKLKIQQEIVYNNKDEVLSEIVTCYDDNHNVVKIVTTKRDSETGNLNVSETDKDGNVTPIQWESTNSETGSKITERNLTSPSGDKTEYYCEESENLKITDYTITDKNGKKLANIHQTFEKVSDNKYVSSINATGQNQDTKIYEIEYTANYKVKILDKKNNKTTIINLKKYIKDDKSIQKLLPILKQLPGQVLLEFSEKPTSIRYDEYTKNNGLWSSWSNCIRIGNYEDSVNENNSMLATLTHELGHFLDLYDRDSLPPKLAQNEDFITIYKEELKALHESTTISQQEHIDYFTNGIPPERAAQERIGETHSILYSVNDSSELNMRRLYFAQYFPKTIAKAMELLLNEEDVKFIDF